MDFIRKLGFLISGFLFKTADLLLLYAIPVILFNRFRDLWLVGLLLACRPLARLAAYTLYQLRLKYQPFTFLLLASFSLGFIVVILINRMLDPAILPVFILILGFSVELFNLALRKTVLIGDTRISLAKVQIFIEPVFIFAAVVAPYFAGKLVADQDYSGVFNYYSVLMAFSAVLMFVLVYRSHPLEKRTDGRRLSQVLEIKRFRDINWTVLLMEIIKSTYWVLFPLYIIQNIQAEPRLGLLVPVFYLPILLLTTLKNVFHFKFWNLRFWPKLLLLAIVLIGFNFSYTVTALLGLTLVLGVVAGFIEISDWYQEEQKENYTRLIYSETLAFLFTVIFLSLLNEYIQLPQIFALLGAVLLVVLAVRELFPRVRRRIKK
jgi:hypothetical protein